ncbi:aldo/keto reductase [Oscillibacter sp.]|uniref:aldo/keto reductase n=1 Tax=Oscillibacter sp. TaxID=1945593 RepID=UPI002602A090|nr:aldo/keto reductase [Oscillibacter sp.]MDD3347899.1 aldo/keto reductase [Oscillibacter sp.]
MRYKQFGKTGMQVSEMALGTWGIGGVGWDNNSEETRLDAIRAAVENGVNFIDTAPAYNGGEAERVVGKAIKNMGARKDVVISTKCGNVFVDGTTYVRDGSRERIRQQCEDSLKNLQTDYIDLYLIHWPDPKVPFAETMDALNQLKKEGKILHVGVSNFSREQMEEAGAFCPIEAFQPQYSMVHRDDEALIKWAAQQGMGIMTYGSLGGGILTGAFRELTTFNASDSRTRFYKHFQEPMFSKVMELLKVMDRFSEEHHQVPLAQIALNWCARKEFVSTCIVGAQSRKKVMENCAAFAWDLTDEEMALLDRAVAQCLDQ